MKTCPKMQAIIEQLANRHGYDLKQSAGMRLDIPGFDQLRIQRLPNGCISVAHIFESKGFLIPDPDVCFFTDTDGNWAPINITQSVNGYRSYVELSEDGSSILRYNSAYQADLAAFCEQWAENLRDQGWLEHGIKYEDSMLLTLPTGKKALFSLGQVVATPGALKALEQASQTAEEFLVRHLVGDWGQLDEQDRRENERALRQGSRLMSAYYTANGTRIWVITEWDRSVTTLLLPSEY